MEAPFGSLSDCWWPVFPFGGAIFAAVGGFGNWWSQESKRRHRRRIELIQAKNQTRTAEITARARAKSLAHGREDEPIEEMDRKSR